MDKQEIEEHKLWSLMLASLAQVYDTSLKDLDQTGDQGILELVSIKVSAVLNLLKIPGEEELIEERQKILKKLENDREQVKQLMKSNE